MRRPFPVRTLSPRGWAAPPAASETRGPAPRTSSWMWGHLGLLTVPRLFVACYGRGAVAVPEEEVTLAAINDGQKAKKTRVLAGCV